jgi:hypothetical protein
VPILLPDRFQGMSCGRHFGEIGGSGLIRHGPLLFFNTWVGFWGGMFLDHYPHHCSHLDQFPYQFP